MYALCPKCHNSQEIRAKQLQQKRGKIICTQCKQAFNPRTSLTDKPLKIINENTPAPYAWQKSVNSHPRLWLIGSLLGLCLLVYQVYYFQGYALSQSTSIRPWLKIFSTRINYPLPQYRNVNEFSTIGSSFTEIDKGHYRLQVSFINHANFSQALPKLKLTLQNIQGGIIAQRLFTAQDYSHNNPSILLASNDNFNIDLLIAVPEQEFGGYQITLQ